MVLDVNLEHQKQLVKIVMVVDKFESEKIWVDFYWKLLKHVEHVEDEEKLLKIHVKNANVGKLKEQNIFHLIFHRELTMEIMLFKVKVNLFQMGIVVI